MEDGEYEETGRGEILVDIEESCLHKRCEAVERY